MGISQATAAERGKLSTSSIYRFEAGIGEPHYEERPKLAVSYGLSLAEFNRLEAESRQAGVEGDDLPSGDVDDGGGQLLDETPALCIAAATEVQERDFGGDAPDLLAVPDGRRWLQSIFEREATEMLTTTRVLTRSGLSHFIRGAMEDPGFREITGGRSVQLVHEDARTTQHAGMDPSVLQGIFASLSDPLQVMVSPAHAGALLILEYMRRCLKLPISWKVSYGHSVAIADNAARGTLPSQINAFTLTLASAGSLLQKELPRHCAGVVMPSMSHGLLAPRAADAAPKLDGTFLLMQELPSSELLVYRHLRDIRALSNSATIEADPIETTQALASHDLSLRTVIGFPHYHFNQRYNGCNLLCNPYGAGYVRPVLMFVDRDIAQNPPIFNALQHAVREAWLSLAERRDLRRQLIERLITHREYTTALLRATGVSMLGLKPFPDGDLPLSASASFAIRRSQSAEIVNLRHRVLRPEHTQDEVEFKQDEDPGAVHYCAEWDDEIIACVSLLPSSLGDAPALQLRAMATDPAWARRGIGTALLQRAQRELGSRSGTLVWCNARMTSREFYEKNGWYVISKPFDNGNAGPSIKMMTFFRNEQHP